MPRNTENSRAAAAHALADLATIHEDDDEFQDTDPPPPEESPPSDASTSTSIWESLPLSTLQMLADEFHLGHPPIAAKSTYAAQLDRFQIPITALQTLSRGAERAIVPRRQSVDDGAADMLPAVPTRRPTWLNELQTPTLPKQRANETFDDYAMRLRNMLSAGRVTDEHRICCLLENTLAHVQATANRLYKRGFVDFESLVHEISRRHPTPHLERLQRFRTMKPQDEESFFNFGERLREEYEAYIQMTADDLTDGEILIQHILKEQLLNIAEPGLKEELRKKWTRNRALTWDDMVDIAEAYRINNRPVSTGSSSGKTGSRHRELPPKQWCEFHKRHMRHGSQECRLRHRAGAQTSSTAEDSTGKSTAGSAGQSVSQARAPCSRMSADFGKRDVVTVNAAHCYMTNLPAAPPPILLQIVLAGQSFSALLDTGASHSFLSEGIANQLRLPSEPLCTTVGTALGPDAVRVSRVLPLAITLDGKRVFTGFQEVMRAPSKPTLLVGAGIPFVDGTPTERARITQLLKQHAPLIRQWSGRRGLFADYVVRIPTVEASPPAVRQFRHSVEHHCELLGMYTVLIGFPFQRLAVEEGRWKTERDCIRNPFSCMPIRNSVLSCSAIVCCRLVLSTSVDGVSSRFRASFQDFSYLTRKAAGCHDESLKQCGGILPVSRVLRRYKLGVYSVLISFSSILARMVVLLGHSPTFWEVQKLLNVTSVALLAVARYYPLSASISLDDFLTFCNGGDV
ncbi:unnamed protein product [Notodromas monacha]|uniref:Peptidase A2 domain-containing protein n=1 Tax=Notodromas monacha TaxID=399045 RepID=A0A7R9GGJ7_9CRUS|nr:unnamed protein product [Notodromas monacha]CAG0921917.1 unnamed protein product [Notodromas monacha]